MTREQDPQDATRIGREAAGRMRLPGPPPGRPLPSRIGSLASAVERFSSSLSRPVEVRRALRGPGSHEESVRPPRWWTGETLTAPAEAATAVAAAPSVKPAWLAGAAARRADVTLPERSLPRAARAVQNEQTYTPGGILGGLHGQVARVRRLEEVAAAGPMLTSVDTTKLGAATLRRRAAEAARRTPPPAPAAEARGGRSATPQSAPAPEASRLVADAPHTSATEPSARVNAPDPVAEVRAERSSGPQSPPAAQGARLVADAAHTSTSEPGGSAAAPIARSTSPSRGAGGALESPSDPTTATSPVMSSEPPVRRASFQLRPVASRLAAARARRDSAELSVSDPAAGIGAVAVAERPGAQLWSEARHHHAAGLRGENPVLRRAVGTAEHVRTATAALLADQPAAATTARRTSWAGTSAVVRRRTLEREAQQAVQRAAVAPQRTESPVVSRFVAGAPHTSATTGAVVSAAHTSTTGDAGAVVGAAHTSTSGEAGAVVSAPHTATTAPTAKAGGDVTVATTGPPTAGGGPAGTPATQAPVRRTPAAALSRAVGLGLAMPDLLTLTPRPGRAEQSPGGLPSSFADAEQIRPATGNLVGALPGATPRAVDAHGTPAAAVRRRASSTSRSTGLALRTPALTRAPHIHREAADTESTAPAHPTEDLRTVPGGALPQPGRRATQEPRHGARPAPTAKAGREPAELDVDVAPAIRRVAADTTAVPPTPAAPDTTDAAALRAFLHARTSTPGAGGPAMPDVARRTVGGRLVPDGALPQPERPGRGAIPGRGATPASAVSPGHGPGRAPEPASQIRRSAADPATPRREDPLTIPEGRPRPPALPIGPSSASAPDVPVVRRRTRSSAPRANAGGSLLDQTAHLFAERSTAPTIRRLLTGTSTSSSSAPGSSGGSHRDAPHPYDGTGPAVPASASLDPGQLDDVIAAVVERIEQRVVDELERRGRRDGRGGF